MTIPTAIWSDTEESNSLTLTENLGILLSRGCGSKSLGLVNRVSKSAIVRWWSAPE